MSVSLIEEIEQQFALFGLASTNYDNRYISKVFRELGPLRRKMAESKEPLQLLANIIDQTYPSNHPHLEHLKKVVGEPVKVDEEMNDDQQAKTRVNLVPEIDLYIHLLVQVVLLDSNKLAILDEFNSDVIGVMQSYNKRTLDFLQAKIWFYISRTKELNGDFLTIRPNLLNALRTSTLRHDDETCGSIITLLLRNYLFSHDINLASNLIEKTEFPSGVSNAVSARYYYYVARVNAIQLDYSSAHECLITAIRKCPQTTLASGFINTSTKLNIVIELLMGDIPDLKVFKQSSGNFESYFQITKAVREGDLKMFEKALKDYEEEFKNDDNYTLILRLRQNVIKTGIRIISLSYSKISLKDICIKLHLDSEESTEYIVAKAIRDGVIEATINHNQGYMQSKELLDIYSTKLPQTEFDQRIKFCLSLHSDSVKAMRYPSDNDNKSESKNSIDSNEEFDLLKAIEEGDLDDFMD